jgi:hypothetical protein
MPKRHLAALVAMVGLVVIAPSIEFASGAIRRQRSVSDGFVRFALPAHWAAAVRPGYRAAHVLLASFRLPSWASDPSAEAVPPVPPSGILITMGDFRPLGEIARWPRVKGLAATKCLNRPCKVTGRVRLYDRAIALTISYGARPGAFTVAAAAAVLASARRSSCSRLPLNCP